MEHHRALRVFALRDVLRAREPDGRPPEDYLRRKIFMWYSEKFSTPLHWVDRLPLDDVLRCYYQAHYEEMDDEAIQAEIRELTESPEQRRARADQANLDALGTWELEQEIEDEEREKAAVRKKAEGAGTIRHAKGEAALSLLPQPRKKPGAEVQLPDAVAGVAEQIQMTFVTLEEMEELGELDGLGQIEPLTGLDDP